VITAIAASAIAFAGTAAHASAAWAKILAKRKALRLSDLVPSWFVPAAVLGAELLRRAIRYVIRSNAPPDRTKGPLFNLAAS